MISFLTFQCQFQEVLIYFKQKTEITLAKQQMSTGCKRRTGGYQRSNVEEERKEDVFLIMYYQKSRKQGTNCNCNTCARELLYLYRLFCLSFISGTGITFYRRSDLLFVISQRRPLACTIQWISKRPFLSLFPFVSLGHFPQSLYPEVKTFLTPQPF